MRAESAHPARMRTARTTVYIAILIADTMRRLNGYKYFMRRDSAAVIEYSSCIQWRLVNAG